MHDSLRVKHCSLKLTIVKSVLATCWNPSTTFVLVSTLEKVFNSRLSTLVVPQCQSEMIRHATIEHMISPKQTSVGGREDLPARANEKRTGGALHAQCGIGKACCSGSSKGNHTKRYA